MKQNIDISEINERLFLKKEWTAFEDIETPTQDKTYYIQNRGPETLIACEGDSEPTTHEGIYVPIYKVLKYVKGSQNLYLRAKSDICTINISDED